jgi:hypothetical protein
MRSMRFSIPKSMNAIMPVYSYERDPRYRTDFHPIGPPAPTKDSESAPAGRALLFVVQYDAALAIAVISAIGGETTMLVIIIVPETGVRRILLT